jgi:hypothetical protein
MNKKAVCDCLPFSAGFFARKNNAGSRTFDNRKRFRFFRTHEGTKPTDISTVQGEQRIGLCL